MATNKHGWRRSVASQIAQPGHWCEFGVYRGASLRLWTEYHHPVYGFDSFKGLPEDWREGHLAGHFATAILPGIQGNGTLVTGLFQDTLPGWLDEHPDPMAFVHIDCDIYSAAEFVLRTLREAGRLIHGTVILYDEYAGYEGWQGHEARAHAEQIEPYFAAEELTRFVSPSGVISIAFELCLKS